LLQLIWGFDSVAGQNLPLLTDVTDLSPLTHCSWCHAACD